MKAIILATAAFVAGASAQGSSQSKVNPPNHASPGPGELTMSWSCSARAHRSITDLAALPRFLRSGYYIYQDVDYIAAPAGNIVRSRPR